MTTRAELKRYARGFLTPELSRLGFELTPKGYCYMRQVGDLWHFILPGFSLGNTRMSWAVTVWVPEFAPQPYDTANLPDELTICCGGRIGRSGIAPQHTYELWPAANAVECERSFPDVLAVLQGVGIPWLEGIRTRDALARNINPESAVDRFGNRTADKVFGRGLIYRDQTEPLA